LGGGAAVDARLKSPVTWRSIGTTTSTSLMGAASFVSTRRDASTSYRRSGPDFQLRPDEQRLGPPPCSVEKTAGSKELIARNWNGSMDDGLNLYVDDPSGRQVGSSAGVGSNGQAVAVTPSVSGVYRIVVTETYQYDQEVTYLGEAQLMSPPSWNVVHCSKPCP